MNYLLLFLTLWLVFYLAGPAVGMGLALLVFAFHPLVRNWKP